VKEWVSAGGQVRGHVGANPPRGSADAGDFMIYYARASTRDAVTPPHHDLI
jgi:hypothetical protein